jgi:hypothetical protein
MNAVALLRGSRCDCRIPTIADPFHVVVIPRGAGANMSVDMLGGYALVPANDPG